MDEEQTLGDSFRFDPTISAQFCEEKSIDLPNRDCYRIYANNVESSVRSHYLVNHTKQTYEFVNSIVKQHSLESTDPTIEMTMWDVLHLLDTIIDQSDPDTTLPQINHLLQSAEACHAAYPEKEWLAITALIHDAGKILAHPKFGNMPQWAVVGDTYPVGCAFQETIIYHDLFKYNPDHGHPIYSTQNGVYEPRCGLRNVKMSYGHDEYLYQVLKANKKISLPEEALYIIRFHSFYAHHQHTSYGHLMDEYDKKMLPWLMEFQKFDLYSKRNEEMNVEQLLDGKYKGMMSKFIPEIPLKWKVVLGHDV